MIESVDLILHNGYIKTIDSNNPIVEAIVIKDGMIVDTGSSKEIIKKYSKYKKVIDLKGKFVCPGFNDTHTHILSMCVTELDVLLDKVSSPQEALDRIKERVDKSPKGKWIIGARWDESNWSEKRYLTLKELDEIAPDNPCYITRVCGHMSIANTLGLKELEVPLDDPDLGKDPQTGEVLGILNVEAKSRISEENWEKLKKTQEEIDNTIPLVCKTAHSLGITSATDNLPIQNVKAYMKAWKNGDLKLRLYMNIPRDSFDHYLESGIKTGFGDKILRLGGVKNFTDGSIGARTAALNEAYFDDTSTKGVYYIDKEVFFQTIEKAVKNNWQSANHAIGDRAIEMVLEAFERIGDNELVSKGRHRIEHAEYLTDDQLKRVNKLGLVLSMQPNFPGRWGKPGQLYEIRLGSKRYKLLNNFKTILASKAKVCFGSDGMPMSPLFGIWSVVTHPIENIKISLDEALYHYTLGAAYASFEENIKGSIEIGKVADLVVLEENLDKIDPEKIKDVKISMTIFDGVIVYQFDN
ncbi:MAG: amidohydrolase [Asgard group archaeon]|nr:amidohydrolase [Asgard group archaeon]